MKKTTFEIKTKGNDIVLEGCIKAPDNQIINIPEGVTRIGEYAFGPLVRPTHIHIPNSVKIIDNNAFSGGHVTVINIPNGVTTIGDTAFKGCHDLSSILIPESVKEIGVNPFRNCIKLSSIEVDGKNKLFDSREDCDAIIESATNKMISGCKNTVIPNSITCIGSQSFFSCIDLTSIIIPNGVTCIEDEAFAYCTNLKSVVIPQSITKIGHGAFRECCSLTSIVIPDGITCIEAGAFAGCANLKSVVIHNGVRSIEDGAFSRCKNLKTITIPKSVSNIGSSIVSDCDALTAIKVEDGNTVFDSREDCNAIIESKSNKLISGCRSTRITESITAIGKSAFKGCNNLSSITIPKSVTIIEEYAFAGCVNLTSVSIPENVTCIGNGAFWECSGLSFIVIPESVKSIGEFAFYECTGLTNVIISEGVLSIGLGAFWCCDRLSFINIPASIISMGKYGDMFDHWKLKLWLAMKKRSAPTKMDSTSSFSSNTDNPTISAWTLISSFASLIVSGYLFVSYFFSFGSRLVGAFGGVKSELLLFPYWLRGTLINPSGQWTAMILALVLAGASQIMNSFQSKESTMASIGNFLGRIGLSVALLLLILAILGPMIINAG